MAYYIVHKNDEKGVRWWWIVIVSAPNLLQLSGPAVNKLLGEGVLSQDPGLD